MNKAVLYILFLLTLSLTTSAQDRFYRSGVKFFENGLYKDALREFSKDVNGEKNRDLLLKRMISNYETNNLRAAKMDISSLLSFKKKQDELYLYIAKIYHAELNFSKAVEYYKEYLRRTPSTDELRPMVIGEIKRCSTGMGRMQFEQRAFVENMGSSINSINDEISPIQSPNYLNKYYFASNRPMSEGGRRDRKGMKDPIYGNYYLDMYSASLENGEWTEVEPLNDLLNTGRHEKALDFNADGSVLVYLKGDEPTKGVIYVDSFGVNKDEIYPRKFKSPLIGEKGDAYLQFYTDSTIIFASKRAGGYGGYDLYVSYKRNSYWSPPKNLGPTINSVYDEVSPFLTKDGMTIYYSSNGMKSIGGFDVFKSKYSYQNGEWEEPENMDLGINSALDDLDFRISSDGQSAYFSSNRKSGSGGYDLYKAYLKKQEIGQLAYNPVLPFIANDEVMKDIVKNQSIEIKDVSSKANTTEVAEEKVREIVIEPLFYGKDENLFSQMNVKLLENLFDIMKIYPNTKLLIESHSLPESQIAYELYFSTKRAEKIVDYFVNRGISKSRFKVRGLGSSYPLVTVERGTVASNIGERLNRRLELSIINIEELPLEVTYSEPVIADFLKDRSTEIYKTLRAGITYKVFVARVQQMYENDVLNYYQDAMMEKNFGEDSYVYTIGLYTSYFDAQEVLKKLKADGIEDAKIIPFLNGDRIDQGAILEMATEYPDLVNYLQYNGQ